MKTKIAIKELADYFDQELQTKLPIKILPNDALGYNNFLIKRLSNGNWGVFNALNKDLINQYYLKSCALMAAKFYSHRQHIKCHEIKDLDNNYWSNYSDSLIFKNIIKTAPDEKYLIILTRLEESTNQSDYYKKIISRLFKHTFV